MSNKKPSLWERTKDVAATYTGTFVVVMILNQLLFFGFCLNPICIIAAMPHVLLITVFIGSIINKLGNWGDSQIATKTAKVSNEKLKEIGTEISDALQEVEKEIEEARAAQKKSHDERIANLNERRKQRNASSLDEANKYTRHNNSTEKRNTTESIENGEPSSTSPTVQVQKVANSGHFEVFITKANLASIVGTLDSNVVSISDFNQLYKTQLNKILSHKEMSLLCIYKEICKNPAAALETYKKSKGKYHNPDYVFQNTVKSYHRDPSCELLNGDYFNLELPPEIKAKGEQEIRKFKEFCSANKNLLEESESKFITKLESHFFLKNPPRKVTVRNSGIERFNNVDLKIIEREIDLLLQSAESFRHSSLETEQIIYRLGYGTHSAKEARDPSNPLYTWHNTYKLPLKELMQNYFRVKFNRTISFNGHLLDNLGFTPCKACSK